MQADLQAMLAEALLALGDDELILGHRDSEWCGYAPILEEDIAFANIALDEIGHAALWYRLVAGLRGEDPDTYPDRLVYRRQAAEFLSLPLVELPKGDWAFSMLRQFLFDTAERVRLEALQQLAYKPVAETAAKILPEERYHERHTRAWVYRLGLGTEESQARLQQALETLWPYAQGLFDPLPGEDRLAPDGLCPASGPLRSAWEADVRPFLVSAGLQVPSPGQVFFNRRQHTPELRHLLEDMQSVARLDPQAEW